MIGKRSVLTVSALVLIMVSVGCMTAVAPSRHEAFESEVLFLAVRSGDYDGVVAALDSGVNINSEDENSLCALGIAVVEEYRDITELLLSRGADVDHRDDAGWTPLMVAVAKCSSEFTAILLESGVDVNLRNDIGDSALLVYQKTGQDSLEIPRLLIDGGAFIEMVNDQGFNPLRLASREGNEALVKLLLDEGASIDAVNAEGRTALAYASYFNHPGLVRLLLEHGAHDTAGTDGYTAFSMAEHLGHEEIIRLLVPLGCVYLKDKTVLNRFSGAVFPWQFGDYVRTNVMAYDDEGMDVSATYVHEAYKVVTTAYVYPSYEGAADTQEISEEFTRWEEQIFLMRLGIQKHSEEQAVFNFGEEQLSVQYGVFSFEEGGAEYISNLFIIGKHDWFIGFRTTYPRGNIDLEGMGQVVSLLLYEFDYAAIR